MSTPKTCPKCNADLTGKPIPQEHRDKGYYGDETHFSRVLARYDLKRDMTVAWVCPDCEHQWGA